MKCKDCFHYDVCTKLTRVVAFGRDIDVDCDNFATDNNVGSKWIPVTERLPEQTSRCLVSRWDYVTDKPFLDILWFEKGVWWNRLHGGNYAVTHWMPLPSPPKE